MGRRRRGVKQSGDVREAHLELDGVRAEIADKERALEVEVESIEPPAPAAERALTKVEIETEEDARRR